MIVDRLICVLQEMRDLCLFKNYKGEERIGLGIEGSCYVLESCLALCFWQSCFGVDHISEVISKGYFVLIND
jgi:hypothetical protein